MAFVKYLHYWQYSDGKLKPKDEFQGDLNSSEIDHVEYSITSDRQVFVMRSGRKFVMRGTPYDVGYRLRAETERGTRYGNPWQCWEIIEP